MEHLKSYIKFAQKADVVTGVLLGGASVWYLAAGDYTLSGLFALGTAVSLLSAKYQPARWVARKMLMSRLK